jgi:PAS domain S-box-containing protein
MNIQSLQDRIQSLERELAEAKALLYAVQQGFNGGTPDPTALPAINARPLAPEPGKETGESREPVDKSWHEILERAEWLARLPGENPNPVARVSLDGIVLYHNSEAGVVPGWELQNGSPLPEDFLPLVKKAMNQGSAERQDIHLADRYYTVTILPFLADSYANVYGIDITQRRVAEKALQHSQAVLAQAGEMAHFGAWDIQFVNQENLDENPLQWSDEVYRIFGYEPGEVEVTNALFFSHVHWEDRIAVKDSVRKAMEEKRPYEIEHRIIRKDGEERILSEFAHITFDDQGRPLQMIGAIQDVTERRQAKKALRESEERFRQLADSMPQLVWTAAPDGTVDYYNKRHTEFKGITPEITGIWHWTPVLYPDDQQRTVDAWTNAVKSGEVYECEHRVCMADGSFRWHLSRGIPVHDEQGHIIRWFGTATDIHDMKQAEEALKQAWAQADAGRLLLEGLLESIPNGIVITGGPPDFLIQKVSRYALDMTGRTPPDLIGYASGWRDDTWTAFFPDGINRPVQEQLPLYRASRFGEETRGLELLLKNQDGQKIPIMVYAAPIRDEEGQIISAINVWHDITQRKQYEEELQARSERLALLSDAAGELLQNIDPEPLLEQLFHRLAGLLRLEVYVFFQLAENGNYLELRALSGFPAEAFKLLERLELGQAISGAVAVTQQAMLVEDVLHSTDERTNMIRSLGIKTYVCYPLVVHGKLVGTLAFGTRHQTRFEPASLDLIQAVCNLIATAIARNQAEIALQAYNQRLEASNRDLQEFAFVASHDLQEPLRKIEAFSDFLLKKPGSLLEEQIDYLDRTRKAALRMRRMVDGLLELSRIATHARPFERVDLSDVVAEVLSDLEMYVQRSGADVQVGELPTVEGDPIQMRQLIQNLVGNALKFQPAGGKPRIRIFSKNPTKFEVQILVEDNGIGFDEGNAERIFQPFQRLVGKSQYEGSGMGLSICRRIVERHGGHIAAIGQKGKGATFIVTLPAGEKNPDRPLDAAA